MAQLRIITTSEWGAVAPTQAISPAGRPDKIIFHHTDGHHPELDHVPTETQAEGAAFARAIQRDHMHRPPPNGPFIDSGHNFLVTRAGDVFEGRHGSLAAINAGHMVVSAHCISQNTNPGIEHEHKGPEQMTPAQRRASIQLHAFICRKTGIAPSQIFGHKEFAPTDCPLVLEAGLPGFRHDVAVVLAGGDVPGPAPTPGPSPGPSPLPVSTTRLDGLWVYQTLGQKPDPQAVAQRASSLGLGWITAQATDSDRVLDNAWLKGMRRAATQHGLKLGVHGYVGRPHPKPVAEAGAMAHAFDLAEADFAIVDAEIEYEQSAEPSSAQFVHAYRQLKPDALTYFSSFGRPQFHAGLDWAAWAGGGFHGMPQAYENLNAQQLKPKQCVDDWARFFKRSELRPTLGCFSEHTHPHLPVPRLVQSVRDVPGLPCNVFHHATATDAELEALVAIT